MVRLSEFLTGRCSTCGTGTLMVDDLGVRCFQCGRAPKKQPVLPYSQERRIAGISQREGVKGLNCNRRVGYGR